MGPVKPPLDVSMVIKLYVSLSDPVWSEAA
jgi:hypothetical protein